MKLLFLCTGNTCRSPMAAALMNKKAEEQKLNIYAESAGISAFPGDRASKESITVMKSYGIDLSMHRSRQLSLYMLEEFDIFVCMTESHKRALQKYVPNEKLLVLGNGIFDPYGGDESIYYSCAKMISDSVDDLIKKLSQVKISEISESDVDNIAEIEKECFSTPWSYDSVRSELKNDSARFFKAEILFEIVGYMGMHIVLDECYIANIAVKKNERRKGIATALLKNAIDTAKNEGCSFISLEVRKSNSNAISLYEKNGFILLGERRNFYSAPTENAMIMTKYFNN